MPRNYPPMSNDQAIAQANKAANGWFQNNNEPNPWNTGNQSTEYILSSQAKTIMAAWETQGVRDGWEPTTGKSQSAGLKGISLKYRYSADGPAGFNYHIAFDTQK